MAALSELSPSQINAVDKDGRNLLMHAVLTVSPNDKVIQFLIDTGINIEHRDKGQSWTALHFAARDQKNNVVELLLRNGAIVDPIDTFGNTPLWRAVMTFSNDLSVIKSLFEQGADISRKNNTDVSPYELAQRRGINELLDLFRGERQPNNRKPHTTCK
ncbi:MAG: ankyrin repeat domain-containing protein [Prolixibacteraceae bacterium]|nr:ankyrin repeat domain-containing protein [Prolixibacteraceae bacterium]